jgi:O-antigen ligase
MPLKTFDSAYFIFLVLLPFAYFTNIIDPVLIPRQAFLGAFMLVLLLLVYFKKVSLSFFALRTPIYIAVFAYFALMLCSFFGNNFTSESHYILSKQLLLFSFLLLTIALLYSKAISTSQLVVSGVCFGFIAVGSAMVQLVEKSLTGRNLFHKIYIIEGLFANKNLLASILFLSIIFFFMGLQQSKAIKWLSVFGIFCAFSIIIIIRTRVVLAASVLFLLLLLGFWLRNHFKMKNRNIAFSAAAMLVAAGAVYQFFEKHIQHLKSSPNVSEQYFYRLFDSSTLKSRMQFWENSIAMFKDHPVFGVGLGNFQVEFPKYGLEKFHEYKIAQGEITLQRPHNDFLNILCENGILGFAAFAAIFGIVFYCLFSLIKNAETPAEKWKFIYIFCGICAYAVISFFDFPFERIEHQVLLMLLFAISIAAYYSRKSPSLKPNSGKNVLLYVVLFIAVYSLLVASLRFKGEMETAKIYAAKGNAQWDEMLYCANKSGSIFYKIDPTSIPIDWYKGLAYFNQNEVDESIKYFENAYKLAPYQIQVINNLGTAYQSKGDTEKAIGLYLEALKISPGFEESRLNLAAIYFNDKQFGKAFEMIDQINIDSKNSRYSMFLVPILTRELNRILKANANDELSKRMAAHITSGEKIVQLYFDSKKNKSDFRNFVLNPGLALK